MKPPASVVSRYEQTSDDQSYLKQAYSELGRTVGVLKGNEHDFEPRLVLPVGMQPAWWSWPFHRNIKMVRLMRRKQLFLGTNNRVYRKKLVNGVAVCYAEDLSTWRRDELIWLIGRAKELRSQYN
ncbi:MAG TPA: hypothetical protein PK096_03500 [Candidatus Saccharibacteria bacterium]|nr:hypothetical protein [Candidatus Saccharibacteria bacterium]HRK94409.1 hypothetical protein [Candidatus Saccharibacteria bacterium]